MKTQNLIYCHVPQSFLSCFFIISFSFPFFQQLLFALLELKKKNNKLSTRMEGQIYLGLFSRFFLNSSSFFISFSSIARYLSSLYLIFFRVYQESSFQDPFTKSLRELCFQEEKQTIVSWATLEPFPQGGKSKDQAEILGQNNLCKLEDDSHTPYMEHMDMM